MEEKNKITFAEEIIFAICILKGKFEFSRLFNSFLIFLIHTQPIFFIFQLKQFEDYKNVYIYQFLELILRPLLKLERYFSDNLQYCFLVVSLLTILHKCIFFTFFYSSKREKNWENFIKQVENSFFKKIFCSAINLYQMMASSYLFLDMNYIVYASLKIQISDQSGNQGWLIFLCLLTFVLIIIDSILAITLQELIITNKVHGLEKITQTFYRFAYQIFIVFQILLVLFMKQNQIEYVLSVFSLLQQITIIVEIYFYYTFVLFYQVFPTLVAVALTLSFHFSIILISLENLKEILLFVLIQFSIILTILLHYYYQKEKHILLSLFKEDCQSIDNRRIGLMKILNNELYFQKEDLIYKILVGRWHSQTCQKKKCQYCNHLTIIFNESSAGITNQMHKEFIQFQCTALLVQLDNININERTAKQSTLLYAFFLYDFGQFIRSIKLLDNILTNNFLQKSPLQQENNSVCQSELHSDGTSVANRDIAFQIQDQQVVSQKFELSFFEKISVQFILKCAKSMIGQSLFGTSLYATQQSMIQEFTEDHLKNEVQLKFFEEKIFYLIELKQKFYKNSKDSYLLQTGQFNLNREVLTICYEIYRIYKQLKIAYKERPSKRFHSIFCFFLCEILCNYNKGIQFFKNSKFLDAELIKFQKITNFNVNQKDVQYIILELRNDMQNLKINTTSIGFFDKFGFKSQKEKVFEDLLPEFLSHYHHLYVKQLFETGQSKYYNIFNVNFITNPYHLITAVNMCHTVTNLFSYSNMTFSVFLQEASQDQAFLLIDGKSLHCLFTKNLLLLIGWMESEIEILSSLKKLSNIEVQLIFPNFSKIIKTTKSKDLNKISSAVLFFPTPQTSFEFLISEMQIPSERGKKSLKFTSVECDIFLSKRQIGTYIYYILDVIKIIQQQFTRESFSSKKFSCSQTNNNNQSIEAHEDCIFREENESPNIAGLNSINFFQQNLMGSIKTIVEINNQVRLFPQDPQNVPVLNSRREETQNQSEFHLHTQRNSQLKQDNPVQSCARSSSVQQKEKKKKNLNQNNFHMEEQKNQHYNIHKHYDIVQQLLEINPIKIQIKFLALFTFWFLVFLTFVITQQVLMTKDLYNFQKSIQLISFYSAIMAPHELFFSMRVTITAYQQMNREGFLPSDILASLTEPYYQNISLGYNELRENLYEQLSNEYLQPFLDNINITMYFMKENASEIYPIDTSFRDSLFIVLQYQYVSMITFYHRESTSGKPFQVSLYANYFNFHQECYKLTKSMQEYTINQNHTVQNKWYMIWSVFSLALLITYCYIQISQILFFVQLQQFYKLILLITEDEAQRETLRYSELCSALKNNFTLIENYNPEQQLQIIVNKITSKRKNHSSQKQTSNEMKMPNQNSRIKLINILVLIILLAFLMLFSLLSVVTAQGFFQKCDATTNFYQQILEMKFRPGSLYLYREIFFRWSNFTFLTNENKNQLYDLVDKAFVSIDQYLQIASSIDFNSYFLDSQFINLFEEINTQEFCSKIDQTFKKLSTQYCNYSFEGSINKGMIQTLNYISNKVRAEQAINNFTSRAEYQLYEQEGSQIVSRIFFVLANQFSQSIENQINDLLNYFKILSIIYSVIILVIQILIYYYYSPFLGNLVKLLKQTVFLIPFESLMVNEHLERKLKELKFRFYG